MNSNDKTDKTEKYLKQLKFFAKNNENDKIIVMLDKIDKLDMKIEMITPFIDAIKPLLRNKDKAIDTKALKFINKWSTLTNNIKTDQSKNILNKSPTDIDTNYLKESVLSSLKNEMKRKSDITAEDLKPQKVRKTNKSSKRSIKDQSSSSSAPSANTQRPQQEITGISFFDAIKTKTTKTCTGSIYTNVSKQKNNNTDGENRENEYPESVVENMEKFCEMFEEWKRSQNFAKVGLENCGRISAITRVMTKKKKMAEVVELSLVEKFRENLQMCIEDVECIDGIPYEILKPVLYQLSTSQLERFESYNPDVISDNGDLWKKHVLAKKCPKQANQNLGWREIWMKTREESKASFERSFVKSIKLLPESKQRTLEIKKSGTEPIRQQTIRQQKSNTSKKRIFIPFNKPEVSSREQLLSKLRKLSRR